MSSRRPPSTNHCRECRPRKRPPYRDLDEIVQEYIDNCREDARKELEWFAEAGNLRAAIRKAARSVQENGKRHPHQYRIPAELLEGFEKELVARESKLASGKSFDDLMKTGSEAAAEIWKRPRLTLYDVVSRIAFFRKMKPNKIYLHAGVREGAKALNVDDKLPFISHADLPRPFRRLGAYEIEDCLCIYKEVLKRLRRQAGQ